MTLMDLKEYIDKEIPIIILLQAWSGYETDYSVDFEDGHWVVVIGYDTDKIIFEDPYSFERTYLSKLELEQRWQGQENKKKIMNFGIAVFGETPKYQADKIIHME